MHGAERTPSVRCTTWDWVDLAHLSPNGESVVESGYVADDNTIILQVVELQEVGRDGLPKTDSPSTFAAMKTLTRGS